MKTIALLPEGHWPGAGAEGVIRFTDDKVLTNLVKAEVLTGGGVSDPWAVAKGFAWRLELLDRRADRLLELLLLARYLDLVETRSVTLRADGDSRLQRVLVGAIEQNGPPLSLMLFNWCHPPDGAPRLLGAGLKGRWPLFPSAHYQSAEGLQAILELLARQGGDVVRLEGDRVVFQDAVDELAFRSQVAALAARHERVPISSPWSGRLKALAGNVVPAHGADIDELIYPRSSGDVADLWRCPQHNHVPWARDPSVPDFHCSAQTIELRCALHDCVLESGGRAVTLEDLGAAVVSRTGEDEILLWEDGAADTNVKRLRASGSRFNLQYAYGPRFVLDAKSVAIDDVLCTPVPLAKADFGHSLPVKARYADLLQRYEWAAGEAAWRVKLRGRREVAVVTRTPVGRTGPETGFVVWPQRPTELWYADVVVARCAAADELALVERLTDGTHILGAYRGKGTLLTETHSGVARFVALRADGHDRGLVPLERQPVPRRRSGSGARVALDFGTSNSLVCVQIGSELKLAQHGVRSVREAAHVPVMGQDFLGELQGGLDVFHAAYELPNPSSLLGTLLLKKLPEGAPEAQWSVIPRDPDLLRNFREAPGTKLYTNLKWQDISRADDEATRTYLERILLPVVHDLLANDVSSCQLVATFPLAFESHRRKRFEQVLKDVVRSLAQRTGLALDVESVALVSESRAGVRAVPTTRADYHITIDMGGGTTDIAIVDSTGSVLVADSIRVGGRRFLEVFAAKRKDLAAQLTSGMGVTGGQALRLAPETLMETILQAGGVDRLMAHVPPDNDIARRRAFAALLAGVVVVTRRLLSISLGGQLGSRPSANVYLLGQGWGLLNEELTCGFSEQSFTRALTNACQDEVTMQVAGLGMDSLARKRLVVDGAMKLLVEGRVKTDTTPGSYVGMDLRLAGGGQLNASERLGGRVPPLVTGDPGFCHVIDELAAVMPHTVGDRFALPPPEEWLEERDPATTVKRRDQLVASGCDELDSLTREEGNGLRWSPLVRFVSVPWTEFWVQSVR